MSDNSVYSAFYKIDNGYLLRFTSIGDFHISSDGTKVTSTPKPNVSERDIELTFYAEVQPLLLSLQQKLILHASSIVVDGGVVAFSGKSGEGKSTLATSFITLGYQVFTDDCFQAEKQDGVFLAKPGQPFIQLYPDSYSKLILNNPNEVPAESNLHKLAITAEDNLSFPTSEKPLRFLYFLGEKTNSDVSIQPLNKQEAIIEMAANSFQLELEDQAIIDYRMSQFAELAEFVRAFRINYPRDYSSLPKIQEAILGQTKHSQQLIG